MSYTPTPTDGAGYYTLNFYEWPNGICSGSPSSSDFKSFFVAKATAYTSAALTTPTSSYSEGATAYVVVNTVTTAGEDWNVTWLAPDVACANTAGTDRPDSAGYAPGDGPAGRLPNTAGSYLAYPPTTGDAWNTLANYETQTACDPLGGDNAGQWRLTLYHDPTHHVTLDAFSVTANSAPATPTSLAQYRSDGTTGIAIGGATNQATVVLKAVVSDPDPGQSVRLEAEIEAIGSDFDGAGTSVGALVTSGSTASVTISGLWVGLGYHWRARTVDAAGATTDWVSFGGNAESEPDFSVEQTPPAPPATVFDGPNAGVDEDYASWTADTSSLLYGNWTASTSSDVAGYAYAVGTTPGATNLVGWTSVGSATSFGKVLAPAISVGSVYYITVRATDTAGNTSATTFSDGITVIDHPRVDKVFTDAALTDENYVLAAGETAHALAVGLRGTSTKSYRLVVYASSPVYTGPMRRVDRQPDGLVHPDGARPVPVVAPGMGDELLRRHVGRRVHEELHRGQRYRVHELGAEHNDRHLCCRLVGPRGGQRPVAHGRRGLERHLAGARRRLRQHGRHRPARLGGLRPRGWPGRASPQHRGQLPRVPADDGRRVEHPRELRDADRV